MIRMAFFHMVIRTGVASSSAITLTVTAERVAPASILARVSAVTIP